MEYFIVSAISLLVLICFFYLCANVTIIKKQLKKSGINYWKTEFNKARAFNRYTEAKRCLEELLYCEVKRINENNTTEEFRITAYTHLKEVKYKEWIENYEMEFPDKENLLKI